MANTFNPTHFATFPYVTFHELQDGRFSAETVCPHGDCLIVEPSGRDALGCMSRHIYNAHADCVGCTADVQRYYEDDTAQIARDYARGF